MQRLHWQALLDQLVSKVFVGLSMSHQAWGPKRQARAKRILKRLVERKPEPPGIGFREYLLPMRRGEELSVAGTLEVRVLRGSLEVLGSCLQPSRNFHLVAVPEWSPCVRLRAAKAISCKANNASSRLRGLRAPTVAQLPHLEAEDVLSFLDAHASPVVVCLRFTGASFQEKEGQIKETLLPALERPRLRTHRVWRSLVDRLTTCNAGESHRVLLVMGSKGVGKSTCCRHLLNSMLTNYPEVCYLETDVGQPELGAPGMVSLYRLRSPMLQPSHAEQHGPHECLARYFTGAVAPALQPLLYVRCVRAAFDAYSELAADTPADGSSPVLPVLVVNTMGWVTGLGLELLRATLSIVRPLIVVRIQATKRLHEPHVPNGLVPENHPKTKLWSRVAKQRRPVLLRCGPLAAALNRAGEVNEGVVDSSFVLVELESLAKKSRDGALVSPAGPKPPELRWLRFACNFRPDVGPCRYPAGVALRDFFGDLPRWEVPFVAVRFGLIHGPLLPSEVEAAFTGTLVALCRASRPVSQALLPDVSADGDVERDALQPLDGAAAEPTLPRVIANPVQTAPRCNCIAFVHSFDFVNGVVVLYTPAPVQSVEGVTMVLRGDIFFTPNSVRGQQVRVETPSTSLTPVSTSPLQPYCSSWPLEGLASGTRLLSTRTDMRPRRLQRSNPY